MHLGACLGVSVVNTQQNIGEGIASVERVGGVISEVNVALDMILGVACVRGPLIIEAELEGMLPADLRQVVNKVVDNEMLVEGSEN